MRGNSLSDQLSGIRDSLATLSQLQTDEDQHAVPSGDLGDSVPENTERNQEDNVHPAAFTNHLHTRKTPPGPNPERRFSMRKPSTGNSSWEAKARPMTDCER